VSEYLAFKDTLFLVSKVRFPQGS